MSCSSEKSEKVGMEARKSFVRMPIDTPADADDDGASLSAESSS